MTDAQDQNPQWIVRLTPLPDGDIERLLPASCLAASSPTTACLQSILYPWSYTSQPIPDASDLSTMTKLAKRMQQLLHKVHDETYTPQQSSQLYLTAGDPTDWTYGEYGIPSFTIELRPDSVEQGGFILPPEQIEPTFEENLPAAMEFIKRIL